MLCRISVSKDVLTLYADVMEKDVEMNSDDWAIDKMETLKGVQAELELIPKVNRRKSELEKAKAKHGSIASVVRTVTNEVSTSITTLTRHERKRKNPFESPKKPKTKIPNPKKDPRAILGKRVAKYFDRNLFFGTVKNIVDDVVDEDANEVWWHILYDDDDEEDMDAQQVRTGLKLYIEHCEKDLRGGAH